MTDMLSVPSLIINIVIGASGYIRQTKEERASQNLISNRLPKRLEVGKQGKNHDHLPPIAFSSFPHPPLADGMHRVSCHPGTSTRPHRFWPAIRLDNGN